MIFEADIKRAFNILIYKLSKTTILAKKIQHKLYALCNYPTDNIVSLIDITKLSVKNYENETMMYLFNKYYEHRFNFLGSGWVKVSFGSDVLGVEGKIYQNSYCNSEYYFQKLENRVSKNLYLHLNNIKKMIDPAYEPIAWNCDYKSGYSWDVDFLDQISSENPSEGVDIKTVWELARMQFLIQLAFIALSDEKKRIKCMKEFKNLTLDFFSANPVGIGVNWMCSMDVAIRAVNILLAFDLFKQLDNSNILNEEYVKIINESIYLHGKFIFDNLEKDIKTKKNGNHYYSNIVGLLYISSYFGKCKETKKWFNFARSEFFSESEKQFFDDGGNIEASTSYHRLMLEMMMFGIAIMIREGYLIPISLKIKICRAAYFTKIITKRNGNIIQIGDNDSGRFIKLNVFGSFLTNEEAVKKYINLDGYLKEYYKEEQYFDENDLNHISILYYINGIYLCDELGNFIMKNSLESNLLKSITNCEPEKIEINVNYRKEYRAKDILDINFTHIAKTEYVLGVNQCKMSEWGYFENFGLYYYKNEMIDFFVYTGGRNGRIRSGHSHNDILHCELSINGDDILIDSGTYLYRDSINEDNYFRSVKAHFVPYYNIEPRKLVGKFGYIGYEKCEIISLSSYGINLYYETNKIRHKREIKIKFDKIIIVDYGDKYFEMNYSNTKYISNGYGKLIKQNIDCIMETCNGN